MPQQQLANKQNNVPYEILNFFFTNHREKCSELIVLISHFHLETKTNLQSVSKVVWLQQHFERKVGFHYKVVDKKFHNTYCFKNFCLVLF